MSGLRRLRNMIGRLRARRELARWRRLADRLSTLPKAEVRQWRSRARELGRTLERVTAEAEERLAPTAAPVDAPRFADWAFRPLPWRLRIRPHGLTDVITGTALCEGVAVHHDSRGNNLVVRQIRNEQLSDLAPFSLSLETLWEKGDFLSLSVDIPENVALALRRRHILRVDLTWETEHPVEGFVRLNIRHGPNTEQIVRALDREQRETCVEFDLAYSPVNEKRVEHAWVDLIFEKPGFNRIVIGDVTMTRRQRAEV